MVRGFVVTAVVILALVAQPVAVAAPAAAATVNAGPESPEMQERAQPSVGPGQAAATASTDDIVRTITFSLTPSEPGSVDVELSYRIPDSVVELRTSVPAAATVTETNGFDRGDSEMYSWDGDAANPTIHFSLPANRSGAYRYDRTGVGEGEQQRVEGPSMDHAASEGLLFADTGSWALISVPPVSVSWSYRGEPTPRVIRRVRTAGEGIAGKQMVFLGSHRSETRTIDDQRVTLVVPEAATLEPKPETVFASIHDASTALQVGPKPERMVLFAAPTTVEWGPFGLAQGSDAWVRADQPITDPNNVWLHEYVHVLQDFETTADSRWTREAMAEYYSALLTLQQGHIGFDTFQTHLEEGTKSRYADTVLSRPDTWASLGNYVKGALVFGTVDRQMRVATGGRQPASHLVREMNEREQPVDHAFLVRTVDGLAGSETAAHLDRYATSDRTPQMWGRGEHSAAFSRLPPRIVTTVGKEVTVSGQYRNQSVRILPPLVPGERLSVQVQLENVGDATGEYHTELLVNGEGVATERGTLEGGASTTITLNHAITSTGPFEVGVGSRSWNGTVLEPLAPTVTNVVVSDEVVEPGETVEIAVQMANPGDRPAAGEIAVLTTGTEFERWTQHLGIGESATRTVEVTFDEPGEYVVHAGAESASVSVQEAGATPSDGETSQSGQQASGTTGTENPDTLGPLGTPGLGITAALLGLVIGFLVARYRKSEGP